MNHSMCSCQGAETKQFNISGGNDEGVPPVPIPNTEVKPQHADSTWVATPREGRSSPDSISFGVSIDAPFFVAWFRLLCYNDSSKQTLEVNKYEAFRNQQRNRMGKGFAKEE